jgi:hypothetical protein
VEDKMAFGNETQDYQNTTGKTGFRACHDVEEPEYTEIKLNGDMQTYCCPEIVSAVPSTLGQEEQRLIRVFMRRNIMYVLSAKIILAAERDETYVDIIESPDSIQYYLTKKRPGLEKIIRGLVLESGCTIGGQNETEN